MSAKINKNGKEYPMGVIPNGYPASNIDYNNSQSGLSATNVQGAIDEIDGITDNIKHVIERNDLDSPFDISSVVYPSKYTLLIDGYLYVQTELAGSSAVVRVYGSSETNYVEIRQSANSNAAASVTMPMFCKKGMKVSIISKSSDASVEYIPLNY